MARKCQVTGRVPRKGRSYATRGIARKKKGIGLNITGVTKRRFYPNLFTKRFFFPEEDRFITLKLSAAAIRNIDKLGLAEVVKRMRKEGKKI